MVNIKQTTCRSCGRELGPVAEPVILCGRPFFIGPTVCDACAEAAQSKAQRKGQSRWERLCPELYRYTDIARLEGDLRCQGYDERWTHDVLEWQYGSQGLLLTGPSGVGKSRIMWFLLRRLLDKENRTAVFLKAVSFRVSLQTAARDGTPEEFVRRLVRTDVLFWDDLGQMHLTGAASEMLLHLLEERVCTGRPILATTQYAGRSMDAQFERPEMGQAIRRRLNEFCRVVTVRQLREPGVVASLQPAARR
jgi:IstB-like ATP binding protein